VVRVLWAGGAQKIAIKEASELKEEGHKVKLIFLRKARSGDVYSELLKDLDFIVLNDSNKNTSVFTPLYEFISAFFSHTLFSNREYRKDGRVDFDLLRKVPKIIMDGNYDKIICHDEYAGIVGYYCWKKTGVPYYVYLHESLAHDHPIIGYPIYKYLLSILRNASRLFSVSEKIANDSNLRFGLNVVANFPGFEKYPIVPTESRERTIVSILAIGDQPLDVVKTHYARNPVYLLSLESWLRTYNAICVGASKNTENTDSIIQYFKENKSKVKIIVNLPEKEKMDLLSKSRFLIRFGYREFGVGTSIIEAISCGIPVIMNSDIGTSDIVRKWRAGFVVDPAYPEEIGKLVEDLNEEQYKELVKNVVNLRDSWTWRDHVGLLLK
jgi:glycosyltransferase involved in cell wall biosynthesis